MPRITNKTTGYTEQISKEQWEKIQANPMTAHLFEMTETKVPAELTAQEGSSKKTSRKAAQKDDEAPTGGDEISDQ